jgi:L-seryl-tRNA(Ser) seleniumtransferase
MIAATPEVLGRRADALLAGLPPAARDRVTVTEMESAIGGGSLPGETLESVGLVVVGQGAEALARRLRTGDPAVVGRVDSRAVLLDLRTIHPADDAALADALARALGGSDAGATEPA